ncbi:tetratricopeptide repeat protein [Pseudomonas sp. 5P_3.1_Bac2]|uniref:tetratricopeptide repeat protein n=1 Tax=Pseudomonas sp. 5P_3.1_Bac2 TaxID=2971617 RepID=UPI0021C979F7|nr:tetratricopeptide repeat protein [Pseudomonas sp. 5P_3.1_Bac2]MCU1718089.1 sel1 repeat family protein [Pseudomonas sp. 5P_3.1_Bac2]
MKRTGRTLSLGCLLLLHPLLAYAGGNSLLVPALGSCSLNTVAEELPNAVAACEQAAEGGDLQAEFELGEFYYDGQRTERDLNRALKWFEQASLQGHAQAQFRLGMMFFNGEGVPANAVQAYVVLKMAAVNGSDDAMDSADLIAGQMPRNELEIASQVLGQIFRNYLMELQNSAPLNSPFAPLP